jgi:hypothetical protein
VSPPAHERQQEREPLHLDFRVFGVPVRRPESPPPSRPEGIIRAVLDWLDAQL